MKPPLFSVDQNSRTLLLAGEIQLFSFKIVLLAITTLFLAESKPRDLVLNCLALQFILDVDNMLEGPVQASETVRREMHNWFEGFDWYCPKGTLALPFH